MTTKAMSAHAQALLKTDISPRTFYKLSTTLDNTLQQSGTQL